jgi:hypothetical protein
MTWKKTVKEPDLRDRMLDQVDLKGLSQEEVLGQDGILKRLNGFSSISAISASKINERVLSTCRFFGRGFSNTLPHPGYRRHYTPHTGQQLRPAAAIGACPELPRQTDKGTAHLGKQGYWNNGNDDAMAVPFFQCRYNSRRACCLVVILDRELGWP